MMWRQSREYSWIWLVMAGALLLASPRGRRAAAAWARKAADWLDVSGINTKPAGWGSREDQETGRREQHGPSDISEKGRVRARAGRPPEERGNRELSPSESRKELARGAEGQVIWWVTQSAFEADSVSE